MSLDSTNVSSVMNPDVKTDTEEQNIMSACNIMHENNIGCVILVTLEDREKPTGIFTERDVVRVLGKLSPWLYRVTIAGTHEQTCGDGRTNFICEGGNANYEQQKYP